MKISSLTGVSAALALVLGAQSMLNAPAQAAPAVMSAAAPNATVSFRVFLPLRNESELDALITQLHDPKSDNYQKWLEPADFMKRFGPSAQDLATLKRSLTSHGFTIISEDGHGVRVQGPVSTVARAFAVPVQTKTVDEHSHIVARGTLQLPSEIAALNARVVGLEGLTGRHPHSRIVNVTPAAAPDNRYDAYGSYWFDDLKQAYDYPAYSHKADGTGVTAAVLMTDLLYPGDIEAAFNHEQFTKITGVPVPKVTTVKVDGGGVVNGDGSVEASLDVQEILGGAPGTQVTLVSIPDLADDHILDGYAHIVDKNAYDLVNSSFGGCELEYTPAFNEGTDFTYILKEYHEIFQQGNAQGITFVASSGDEGALGCPSPWYGFTTQPAFWNLGVETPAADPDVTAVGGGNLFTTYKQGSLNSAYVKETAYDDPEIPYDIGAGDISGGVWAAGGGVSQIFKKPLYQYLANTGSSTQRTLPDVGMQVGGCPGGISASTACETTTSSVVIAYGVNYGGGFIGLIGTSVSSPEFVSSLAVWEEQHGKYHRQGNANYFLYAQGAVQSILGGDNAPGAFQFYHRNIPGFDGYYSGGKPSYNYDYIYGLGSPDVRKLFGLEEYPAAGVPQTPSNP